MKETIFCIISAFILYEVSGIIGKEMLADKHITGEGKGYCDITFGKDYLYVAHCNSIAEYRAGRTGV